MIVCFPAGVITDGEALISFYCDLDLKLLLYSSISGRAYQGWESTHRNVCYFLCEMSEAYHTLVKMAVFHAGRYCSSQYKENKPVWNTMSLILTCRFLCARKILPELYLTQWKTLCCRTKKTFFVSLQDLEYCRFWAYKGFNRPPTNLPKNNLFRSILVTSVHMYFLTVCFSNQLSCCIIQGSGQISFWLPLYLDRWFKN